MIVSATIPIFFARSMTEGGLRTLDVVPACRLAEESCTKSEAIAYVFRKAWLLHERTKSKILQTVLFVEFPVQMCHMLPPIIRHLLSPNFGNIAARSTGLVSFRRTVRYTRPLDCPERIYLYPEQPQD